MVDGRETAPPQGWLRMSERLGRITLFAAVLGSSLALLDSTVVNVALPRLGRDLGASVAGLQWTVNGYTLTLAAFILLGGSLGDRYGRRRVFVLGAAWFAGASFLCGLSPSVGALVGARLLQGVGGALLTPGSLALIQSTFHPDDRGRAVGAWSGLTGIAAAVGPLVGGWLVGTVGWRWVFWINLPLAAVVVVVSRRYVRESTSPDGGGRFDVAGALLAACGLGALTYALISIPRGASPLEVAAGVAGVAALAAFVATERRVRSPMVPLGLFSSRQFSAVNAVTLWVYAANGLIFFFVVLQLQVVAGYTPIAAGVALMPVTAAMLLLSSRAGALGQRIGPRLPMTAGTALCAVGAALLAHAGTATNYTVSVLPGAVLFGLGLSLTVAPLTAAVLAAVGSRWAGVASGVNNAVARAAGLLSVSVVPVAVGLSGSRYRDPAALGPAYRQAMYACSGLMAVGAVLSWATVSSRPCAQPAARRQCPVAGPPLAPGPGERPDRTGPR